MNGLQTAYYESDIGVFKISGSEAGLGAIEFTDLKHRPTTNVPACLRTCFAQLDEYFSGKRTQFDLKLAPKGTEFQKAVWHELMKIPYGRTTTYLEIANVMGKPEAVRAVGAANGQNRIPIIIPCHRVIGSNGMLIGFGGGIWRKEYLLRHENVVLV